MFAQPLFNLISRLIFSRRARGYEEHHGPCEDTYAAQLGLLHLEVNRCFVLDHDDACISIHIPTPLRHAQGWHWGKLHLGYIVCLGEDEIRKPGFYTYWQKRLLRVRSAQVPKVVYGKASQAVSENAEEFPF